MSAAAKMVLEALLGKMNSEALETRRLLEVARAHEVAARPVAACLGSRGAAEHHAALNAVRYIEGRYEQAMRDIAHLTTAVGGLS